MLKTGECYFRDEDGVLYIAESFVDNTGAVYTEVKQVQE